MEAIFVLFVQDFFPVFEGL